MSGAFEATSCGAGSENCHGWNCIYCVIYCVYVGLHVGLYVYMFVCRGVRLAALDIQRLGGGLRDIKSLSEFKAASCGRGQIAAIHFRKP